MWQSVKSPAEIREMAGCRRFPRGDVIAWSLDNFNISRNIVVTETTDDDLTAAFCDVATTATVFPGRRALAAAKTLCAAHGGRICTPRSRRENQQLVELVRRRGEQCRDGDRMAWLGLRSDNIIRQILI